MLFSKRCLGLTTVLILSASPLGCIITTGGGETDSESAEGDDSSSDAEASSSEDSTDGSTSGDGDGDSGDGDGDSGDGDGDSGDGDGDSGDGDGDSGDGDGDGDGDMCDDLAGVDLGPCDAILGWAVSGGTCMEISGCEVPAPYQSSVYETQLACVSVCGSDGCTDLAGEDFGPCAAVLGYGVINGNCTAISGCDIPAAYEGDVYETMDACSAACS